MTQLTGGHGNNNAGSKLLYAGIAIVSFAIMQPRGGYPHCERLSNSEWLLLQDASDDLEAGEQGPPAGDVS
jgi:hypothetical protein